MFFTSKKLNLLLNQIHKKLFGHDMSDEMQLFLRNLSWSFLGGIASSAIMFFLNIIAGRALGPYGFGQYNSLFSLASAFAVFILLGNDSSSVRFIADKNHKDRENQIFSASFWLTIFQFILLIVLLTVFGKYFTSFTNIAWNTLIIGLLFSLTLALKNLSDSYLRAFYLIKKQSLIRVVSATFALVFFVIFFFLLGKANYYWLVGALVISNLIFVVMATALYLKHFSKFNFSDVKLLVNYNKYLVLGTFALMIISAEHFFIGKFVGTTELGIYSAYWYGSFLVISHLSVYFINIFWPAAIKNKHKMASILSKLRKLILISFPLWIIADFTFVTAIIMLFGKNYPLRLEYLILFPIAAFASGLYILSMHLLYIDRVRLSSVVSLITGISLISFLAITRNLPMYLAFQFVFYTLAAVFIFNRVEKDLIK